MLGYCCFGTAALLAEPTFCFERGSECCAESRSHSLTRSLALALAFAVALALPFRFRGPIPQRQGRQIQPAGRRAGMRDVFVRDMDVPHKNFCRTCAPVARSASGARTECVSLVTFLCTSKESNSRPKGVKALLPVSSCIKENTQPRGARTKTQKLHSPHPTKQPVNRSTGQPVNQPHTFNNKNSRSHELITRKNVSYSFRFTEI